MTSTATIATATSIFTLLAFIVSVFTLCSCSCANRGMSVRIFLILLITQKRIPTSDKNRRHGKRNWYFCQSVWDLSIFFSIIAISRHGIKRFSRRKAIFVEIFRKTNEESHANDTSPVKSSSPTVCHTFHRKQISQANDSFARLFGSFPGLFGSNG